jgi:hypothetical protein
MSNTNVNYSKYCKAVFNDQILVDILKEADKKFFEAVDSTISSLPAFAESLGFNYKLLKYFNAWLRDDHMKNPHDESFTLTIPHESVKDYDYLMKVAESEMGKPEIPSTEIDSL